MILKWFISYHFFKIFCLFCIQIIVSAGIAVTIPSPAADQNVFLLYDGDPQLVSSASTNLQFPLYINPTYIQADQDVLGSCDIADFNELPFVWTPIVLDNFTYIQFDLKTVHKIRGIRQLLYHNLTSGVMKTEADFETNFKCSFSQSRVDFVEYDCDCTWDQGPVEARFIQIRPAPDADLTKIASAFIPYVETTTPTRVVYHEVSCFFYGFQARVSVKIFDDNLADCGPSMDVAASRGSGNPATPLILNSNPTENMQWGVHVMWSSLAEFGKCVVTFMIEAFQNEYNDQYRFSVGSDNFDITLQIPIDPGEPDYFYIGLFEGNFFVTTTSYTTDSVPGGNPIGSLDSVKDACKMVNGADVLSKYFFSAFQGGSTNYFLQSLVHKTLGTKIGQNIEDKIFLFLQDEVIMWCAFVNATTGLFETFQCTMQETLEGIFCYFYEAEVNSIPIEAKSCAVSDDNLEATVSYTVKPLIIGSLVEREITCDAFDIWGEPLGGKMQRFTAFKGDEFEYSVNIDIAEELIQIQCFTGRRKNDIIYSPTTGYYNLPLNLTTDVVIASPELNFGVAYFKKTDYGDSYEIVVETAGYPIGVFHYRFKPAFDEWTGKIEDGITTSKTYICEGVNLMVKATGRLPFPLLFPEDSGFYRFVIEAGGQEMENLTEFVHPYEINCDKSCVDEVVPGSTVSLWCTIDHHLFVDSSHFELPGDEQPFNMKFWKSEYHPDLPDYNQLNPCEYQNEVENPIRYSLLTPDLFGLRAKTRTANVTFILYSAQEWNVGTYYLEISTKNESYCHYFGASKIGVNCTGKIIPVSFDEVESCSLTGNEQYKLFRISLNQDVGRLFLSANSSSNNSRALFLADDANGYNEFSYFYKLIIHSAEKPPAEVCEIDGGEYTINEVDPVASAIFLGVDLKSVPYAEHFDLINFWHALTCNAYLFYERNPQPNDPNAIYFQSRNKEIVYENDLYQFVISRFYQRTSAQNQPVASLCKFKRGILWNLYQAPSQCMYEPLDLTNGMKQTIYPVIHGQFDIKIECEPRPLGSYINQTFDHVSPLSSVEYSIPYPEERDVTAFRCVQKLPEGMTARNFPWFDFTFNSLPVELFTDESIEPLNYWCYDGNVTVAQPCFGLDVSLRGCVEANPFDNCRWIREYSLSGEPLIQGQDDISWHVVPDENPQCTTTRRCFYLEFANLDPVKHNGIYYLNCSNGLEGTIAETTLRRETKFFKVGGFQSAPIGDYQFSYDVKCGQNAQLKAQIALYGPLVHASVQCTGTNNENIITEISSHQIGVSLVEFVIPNVDRTVSCTMTSSNNFTLEKPLVLVDSLREHKIWSDLKIVEIARDETKISLCCETCAVNIRSNNIDFTCHKLSNNYLFLRYYNTTFEFSEDTFIAKRCADVPLSYADLKCKCTLFNSVQSSFSVYQNGDVEIVTEMPPSIAIMTQPANDSHLLLRTPGVEPATMGPTATTENVQNSVDDDSNLSQEDRIINEYLARIIAVSIGSEVMPEGMLKATLIGIERFAPDELTSERAIEFLLMFQQVLPLRLIPILSSPTSEDIKRMVEELFTMSLDFFETVVIRTDSLKSNESAMLEQIYAFENYTHWLMHQSVEGHNISLETSYTNLIAFKLSGDQLQQTDPEAFKLRHVDMHGVTRHTIQEAFLSTQDVTENAQPRDTAVIIFFNQQIVKSKQKQTALDQKVRLEENRPRVISRFQKRPSVLLLASVMASDSTVDHSVGVTFALNYMERISPFWIEGSYQIATSTHCAYFDDLTWSYKLMPDESILYMEPTRAICVSNHTTVFAIITRVDQVKDDPIVIESFHWISQIGFFFATLFTCMAFFVLLYLSEQLEPEYVIIRLAFFVSINFVLCGYLVGGDRSNVFPENNDFGPGLCTTCRILTQFGFSASMGNLASMVLAQLVDVSDQKMKTERIYLFYFCNLLPIPATHALVTTFLDQSNYEDLYTCFPEFLSVQGGTSLALGGIYIIVGLILAYKANSATYSLAFMLNEESVVVSFETAHRSVNSLLIVCPVVFGFTIYAWGQESWLLHAILAVTIALFSFVLFYLFIIAPNEIKEAYVSHNQIRMPQLKRKRKPSAKNANRTPTVEDTSPVPESVNRSESALSTYSIGSAFFGINSSDDHPNNRRNSGSLSSGSLYGRGFSGSNSSSSLNVDEMYKITCEERKD